LTRVTPPSRGHARSGTEAGVVVAVAADGGLTLRGKEIPIGTIIRDANGRFTGRVVKIFGPVSNPYLSVRPRRSPSPENLLAMVGETMMIRED